MPTALITGGSRGFGRALAIELGHQGWDVIITGRTEANLQTAAAEVPGGAIAVVGDVADPDHRQAIVDTAPNNIDLLVNNASELGPSPLPTVAELSPGDFLAVLDVNVVAPVALFSALLPKLKGDAAVVNISSDAAVEAYEGWGGYGASKSALDHAGAVLAVEHPELKVYAFDPGDMRTEMHQAAFPGEDISDRPLPETVVPALLELLRLRPQSGRYVAAEFLAHAG